MGMVALGSWLGRGARDVAGFAYRGWRRTCGVEDKDIKDCKDDKDLKGVSSLESLMSLFESPDHTSLF